MGGSDSWIWAAFIETTGCRHNVCHCDNISPHRRMKLQDVAYLLAGPTARHLAFRYMHCGKRFVKDKAFMGLTWVAGDISSCVNREMSTFLYF